MHVHSSIFWVIIPLLSSVFSYEDYAQFIGCCTFKGPDFEDIEYILSQRYNEKLMMEYNSTRGNWTGFTDYAMEQTKLWNGDPYDAVERGVEKKICIDNRHYLQELQDNFTTAPTVKLNSVKQSDDQHPAILVCTAYDFYPKQIQVTWLRNGQEVTSGVSCSEVISDGNWNYQIHCFLEYIPASVEKITCMVEHFTLSEPVLQVWDPSLPVPEKIKIAVGLCILMLGILTVTAGFFYYKKKSAAYIVLCQGHVPVPVEELTAAT